MFCPQCGKQIPDSSAFCMFCGAIIPKVIDEANPPFPTSDEDSFQFDSDLFSDMPDEPDIPLFQAKVPSTPPERHCTVCGRLLPESSISDVCVTCLYNRSFVAEELDPEKAQKLFELDLNLDNDYPEAYRDGAEAPPEKTKKRPARQKKVPPEQEHWDADGFDHEEPALPASDKGGSSILKRPLTLLLLVVMIGGAAFGGWKLYTAFAKDNPADGDSIASSQTDSKLSNQQKKAAAYAQEMVKDKAANPESVHFDQTTLKVTENDDVWTVTETFDRLAPSGQNVTSKFTAVLSFDRSAEGGYQALMLQVDEQVFYDNRTK